MGVDHVKEFNAVLPNITRQGAPTSGPAAVAIQKIVEDLAGQAVLKNALQVADLPAIRRMRAEAVTPDPQAIASAAPAKTQPEKGTGGRSDLG